MNAAWSVLLVEDESACADQLAAAIRASPDLQLCGVAHTLAHGRQLLLAARPEVLLLDLGLPDGNGIELIGLARRQACARQILVLTALADHRVVMRCLRAGASGYLLKGETGQDIAAQIGHMRRGGRPISPIIARGVLDELLPACTAAAESACRLSDQEAAVLQLCAKGCTYQEVARMLTLSQHTVETYIKRSFKKLQVHNKTEAIYEARRLGLTFD